ncbi:oligopeptide transport system ATP-binding protein [Mycobacterium frederiksbergense]|uniref:Oligopeptide transport system ATP-binding protein n=1 Tax=Mycolicibacterium frederiksbergense TaxID=117567 RepID=A0ABT6L5W0_9MYCO|nr:ATP-binding cassette domain-containing protein [Mycolicibacterium frederiksbergense]MDH6197345.1 oligopeptide transport system ATP-binding protein [Mycolicibacterium frederiksbergense]
MSEPVLSISALRKTFAIRNGRRAEDFVAVDDVSFSIDEGRSLAVVGESGSGKSTCARIVVGLETPTSGSVTVCGTAVDADISHAGRRALARKVQMVFQDPYSSLDPRQRIGDALEEVIHLHTDLNRTAAAARARELLSLVGLDDKRYADHPRTLSGGQRQRVAIARALAPGPRVLVLDEPVAALDVSIQAQILQVLQDVRAATGVALLFITHDLAVAEFMCDDVVVMRSGRIVESGPIRDVLRAPEHPYTQALLTAVPRRGWKPTRRDHSVIDSKERPGT